MSDPLHIQSNRFQLEVLNTLLAESAAMDFENVILLFIVLYALWITTFRVWAQMQTSPLYRY